MIPSSSRSSLSPCLLALRVARLPAMAAAYSVRPAQTGASVQSPRAHLVLARSTEARRWPETLLPLTSQERRGPCGPCQQRQDQPRWPTVQGQLSPRPGVLAVRPEWRVPTPLRRRAAILAGHAPARIPRQRRPSHGCGCASRRARCQRLPPRRSLRCPSRPGRAPLRRLSRRPVHMLALAAASARPHFCPRTTATDACHSCTSLYSELLPGPTATTTDRRQRETMR